jgi:hypothetical protein
LYLITELKLLAGRVSEEDDDGGGCDGVPDVDVVGISVFESIIE